MRHVSQVLSNTGFSASQFCQDAFLVLCPFLLGPQVWQQVTCVTWTWQAMFLNFTLRCVKFGRTPRRGLQTAQKDSKRCNATFIMVRVSLLQSTELSSHTLMETGNRPFFFHSTVMRYASRADMQLKGKLNTVQPKFADQPRLG